MKIAVDCGHCLSGGDTGARGCGFKEEDKTREIGNLLISKLKKLGHTVVNVTLDNSSSLNQSLSYRSNLANREGVDVGVSIHLNAFNGQAYGVESYILNRGGKSETYAKKIQEGLVNIGYFNRGVKVENFHMVRETIAPWVLIECGFIDNINDMKIFNAEKITDAICVGLVGQKPIITPQSSPVTSNNSNNSILYRVVVGSYIERNNANKRVEELKNKGFECFLLAFEGKFRVICGSYKDKDNANKRVNELKNKGFDSFLAAYNQ